MKRINIFSKTFDSIDMYCSGYMLQHDSRYEVEDMSITTEDEYHYN